MQTAAVNSIVNDKEAVFQKLNNCARSVHSVNLNRYTALMGFDVAQGTVIIAYAMHRKMLETFENLNFPRPGQLIP
jgi:hypothetical protein